MEWPTGKFGAILASELELGKAADGFPFSGALAKCS